MKIEHNKNNLGKFGLTRSAEMRGVVRGANASFEQELFSKRENEVKFKMQELLSRIDEINDCLKKQLTLQDLMLYKKLVKSFLEEAMSRAYLLKRERSRSRRGRSILLTVATIDKEMEGLVNDFIQNKADPMDILDKLDKIRGMLVDLMI
ncbi:YaaR family protein [Thermosyntropha sp.]|uniref:YaaR family protein n=1 Tax=Thermosyntropha sp. TaxID=2740820 RepID=UPI0025D0330E|nr:YaaR family protein [Thermosyntropha sp.]MBO8159960.1 YaaR family protein [Thermosyntropha sp.]